MERTKWSQSAAVRWALDKAIDGATPQVEGALVPVALRRTDLPRELVKMPNASAGRPMLEAPEGARDGRAGRTKLHHNAPFCTTKSSNVRNEPISMVEAFPGLRCATPRGVAQGASATGAAPGIASIARNLRNEPKCTDLHHFAPKCTVSSSHVRNEPISSGSDDAIAPVDQLTPRQLQAIALLFAGRSYTEVGRELKIDRSTLFRWRRSATFLGEVRRRYAMSTRRSVTANGR